MARRPQTPALAVVAEPEEPAELEPEEDPEEPAEDEDGADDGDDGFDGLEEDDEGEGVPLEAAAPPAPPRRHRRRAEEPLPGLSFGLEAAPGLEADEPRPSAFPVALLNGEVHGGPFHRETEDGGPLLEVFEVESVRGKPRRGAFVGRVGYNADEADLLEAVGPGTWYVALRGPGGRTLAGTTVRLALPRGAATRTAFEPAPPAPPRNPAPSPELRVLREQLGLLTRQLEELRRADQERKDRELAELRTLLRRRLNGPAPSATPAGGDGIDQLVSVLERADALRERLAGVLGGGKAVEQKGFLEEVVEEFSKLSEGAENAKGLLSALQEDESE